MTSFAPGAAGAALFALALASPLNAAAAQEPDADTVSAFTIAPLTVTVLRTPFDASDAPYALAAVGERQIQEGRPGFALDEALRGIPGVQVDNRYNYALGERISIRGFGARAQFGVRGVKVMVDGIPATLPDGQTTLNHVDLASLGRAEIIRGPASALYGNAAGGVIQLQTSPPPAVPLRQEVGVVGGEDGLRRLRSTTTGRNGPLSYVLSLNHLTYDGYRAYSEAENFHANARLGYHTERSDLYLTANFVDYDAQNPGSLSEALLAADRFQAFANNVAQQTGEEGRQGQLGLSWRRDLEGGELELSAYGIARQVDNPIPPTIIDLERTAGGVRALYRGALGIGGREARWTVGAEADMQRDDRLNFQNQQGQRGALTLDQFETVLGLGTFAQLSVPLAERLSLMGGIRYDAFRFEVEDRFVAGDPDDSGERSMNALSPSVGVVFQASDPFGLYASVSTSFETPTTTELANRPDGAGGFNPDLDPQRLLSFEVGAKGRLGSRAAYQLALYRANIENALIPFEVPTFEGRQFFRNAGSAVHQGIEAGASVALLQGLLGQLSYTYTDARFNEYVTEAGAFDDNEVPGVAPHRLEAILSYQAGAWYADVEGRYVSKMAVRDDNTAYSPSYFVTDVRAGLAGVEIGGVGVAPFIGVTNLFGEEYNTSVTVNAFGGRYYEPGPDRTLYVGVDIGFGSE